MYRAESETDLNRTLSRSFDLSPIFAIRKNTTVKKNITKESYNNRMSNKIFPCINKIRMSFDCDIDNLKFSYTVIYSFSFNI